MMKAFQTAWEYLKKQLNDKNYKRIILLLFIALMVGIYFSFEKLSSIEKNLVLLAKNDSAIEIRNIQRNTEMFISGSDLFKTYAQGSTNDLKTIVDNTVASKSQALLLKQMLEKNLEMVSQLSKTQQFKNKYFTDTLKHGISIKKISFNNNIDSLNLTSLTNER